MKVKKVKTLINKYCDILRIPLSDRPTFDIISVASDRIEIDYVEGEYWYITNDKVNRFNNRSTKDGEELLYWIFSDITFAIAEEKCKSNKYDDQSKYNFDLSKQQLELIAKLDKKMYKELKEHHIRLSKILEE